jgi:Glyoxalase/Bleomycin resistance protein/Dioxygenase superfamily
MGAVPGGLEIRAPSEADPSVNLKINAPDLVTVEVPVADIPKAVAFYVDVLGAKLGSSRLCVLRQRRIKLLICEYELYSVCSAPSQ